VEEVLKGLAAYRYTQEIRQVPIASKTGFIIDSIKNNYMENTNMWIHANEEDRKFILLTVGAIAMGVDLVGGFLVAMNTGTISFVDKNGENSAFVLKLLIESLSRVGYKDTLKEMLKNYRIYMEMQAK
jgi:hypothetical protein